MKKEISNVNRKAINKLLSELENTQNMVPFIVKSVLNFKGRKSIDIAEKTIKILTKENDTIYDPFMGSGSFVIAAVKANRKIDATEIDNYTFDAVKALFTKIDYNKLKTDFEKISNDVKETVMELYETECCGNKNYIYKLLYDPESKEYFNPTENREIVDGNNIKLVYNCPSCGKKQTKFKNLDLDRLNSILEDEISDFPNEKYIENSRINITASTGANYYGRIFTNRNKKALLLIQKAILKLEDSDERDVLEHALVSALSLSRIAMYGSSTDILYHVVPYGAQECNVWMLFEKKVENFIQFKKDFAFMQQTNPMINKKYDMANKSYQEYIDEINDKLYDMIYTDFPYTDQVPYIERNQLYRIWLNKFYKSGYYSVTDTMLNNEIVQTNSPERESKQSLNNYYKDIDFMFQKFNSILKDNGLLVLTMKLGKHKYFKTLIEIINIARKNGFEYDVRIGIDKNDPSIRKQSAYNNTLSNEMMLIFEKLNIHNRYWYIGNKNYEFQTIKIIYNLIKNNKSDITTSSATKKVIDTLKINENYIANEEDINRIFEILKNNFLIEKNTSVVKIDCNKLYLDIEDNTDLFTKLYEYIPVIIRRLLEDKERFVLDDLYFEIARILCDGDPNTINQFLEDISHQDYIKRLLNSYCTTNGKIYEKKEHTTKKYDNSVDISTLEGKEFELVIKALLENEGYDDVINTGGSGDLGVDLLATKVENDEKKLYLFQCKRWASDVGSEPIQRLDSEKMRRGADIAVCITTSSYTQDGLKVSRERGIDIVDGIEITRRLEQAFPGKYYNGTL